LHLAIIDLLLDNNIGVNELNAIAVTGGPGSYTGLRVSMSTAKGICYAANIPLIIHNTLEVMTNSVLQKFRDTLFCPMLDARRMEVFTAVYDDQLNAQLKPTALILDNESYHDLLNNNRILFFGSGSEKFSRICTHPNALFAESNFSAEDMVYASEEKYQQENFADVAYSGPEYLKEFHDTSKN
jgi:tRNA threonylcarbamoyladenosine biosynthesis protein TsaB